MLKKFQFCKKIYFWVFLILSINLNTCLYGAIYLKSDEKTYVNLTSNFSGDEHAANVKYDSSLGIIFDSGGDIYMQKDSGFINLTSDFNGYAANVIYDSSFGMMFDSGGDIYQKKGSEYINLTSDFNGYAANVIYDSSFGMMFDSSGDIYQKNALGYINLTSDFNGYAANVIYDSSFGMRFSAPTLVNGMCSYLNSQYIFEKPIKNLCSQGLPTIVQGFGPWTWSCIGKNGGSNANCIAYLAKENDKNQSIAPIINFLLFND